MTAVDTALGSVVPRPRIAIVDMAVATNSPAGSCVRAEVEGLARHFDVTVFSQRCDLPELPGLEVVHVPAPDRPVLLRYLAFHLGMPLHHALWRARGGRAALTQTTQGQLPGADIAYAHYCHAGYLRQQWHESSVRGMRRWARWCTHRLNAWSEARAFERARTIVVPSLGLRRELEQQYPQHATKLRVLANPVAVDRFRRPAAFDRGAQRAGLGLDADDLVFGFMALGDFARKGLGLLIEALGALPMHRRIAVRLLVIGGRSGEIAEFQDVATRHGVKAHLKFVGMQRDVTPFLWACDAFAFPSAYEIFSLAILQAAAAGLPVLVTKGLYGAEEFVEDGHNGWLVERDPAALSRWFERAIDERDALPRMGEAAVASAQPYDAETFRQRWSSLVTELLASR